ncbi:TonB-dependent receptor plug domain-containing protein [Hyphomonas atlantica corrig.]|uniref:TonB-dependent receptor plug domain-containing protein n=1 Tax=Hyphomonas atlantica TaxID=1280948 RepID=UPI002355BBD7|nr:hypothetical protein [Hyphomonas atlantica]
MNPLTRLLGGACFSALAVSVVVPSAMADMAPETTPGATIYTIENFRQYAPRTALEMVNRIPGFSIQGDNDGSRGFGQASGNVLINHQRVSGKSNGATDSLDRIAATSVVRIELVDASAFEIPGLSGQVVNVVTSGDTGISGTWRWSARFRDNLPPYYNDLNLTLSGGGGDLSWTFEAESSPERGASNGPEFVTDGQGSLIERREEDFTYIAEIMSVAGSIGWTPPSGAIANLNAKAQVFQPDYKEAGKLFRTQGVEGRRLYTGAEDEVFVEVGGDYEFGLGPGRLKAIGLVRREDSPIVDRVLVGNLDGSRSSEDVFRKDIQEGEYILRTEYALGVGSGADWQIALEGAFNYLEQDSSLFVSQDGGPLERQELPRANSRVEEQRGEISITHGRPLARGLTGQVSLGAEMSELSQSGDASNVRTFTRPKGFASLTWKARPTLRLVTRLEREVGQLDFYDFVSSVNLNAGNGQTGNPEIVPDQKWRLSVQTEKSFGAWGAGTVEVFYEDIEDIVDRVPIGSGDGPGNLDAAWQVGAEWDATLKLAPIGFSGAELTYEGNYYDSELTDPLTGELRPINDSSKYWMMLQLRHDVPATDWAWSVGFERWERNPYYRLAETGQEGARPGFAFAYIEHKDLWGMTGQAMIGNIANQNDTFRRQIYDTNRLGNVVRIEDRARDFGPIMTFTLEGIF